MRFPSEVSVYDSLLTLCCAQSCQTLCDSMNCSPTGSLFVGFSGQEYWSGLPFPPPRDLPNPRIEPVSPELADRFFNDEPLKKP